MVSIGGAVPSCYLCEREAEHKRFMAENERRALVAAETSVPLSKKEFAMLLHNLQIFLGVRMQRAEFLEEVARWWVFFRRAPGSKIRRGFAKFRTDEQMMRLPPKYSLTPRNIGRLAGLNEIDYGPAEDMSTMPAAHAVGKTVREIKDGKAAAAGGD